MINNLIHKYLDWLYTRALKKWLKYNQTKKSYKYFKVMKKRSEKLVAWEEKHNYDNSGVPSENV